MNQIVFKAKMSGFTRKEQQVLMNDEPSKVVPNQTLISRLDPLANIRTYTGLKANI